MKFALDRGRLTVYVNATDRYGQDNRPLVRELISHRLIDRGQAMIGWQMPGDAQQARFIVMHDADGPSVERQAEQAQEYADAALKRAVDACSEVERHIAVLYKTGKLANILDHTHPEHEHGSGITSAPS